jgi:HlyD family secretion protein
MTVSIDIEVADKPDAIVVPAGAVHDARTPAPWVAVVTDGRAERRDVTLGARNASDIEVVRGLAIGETLVLTPDVAAGAQIRVR